MQTMTKFHAAVSARLGAALGAVLFGLCAHALAGGSPEEFTALIRADSSMWSRVVKDAGIRIE